MNVGNDLEQLRAIRPTRGQDFLDLVGPLERDVALRHILTSPRQAAEARRRRRHYATPVALTAAAAAAAIVGSFTIGDSSDRPDGQHPTAVGNHATVNTPPVQTVAYVVKRGRAALASQTTGSLQVTTSDRYGSYRNVYDLSSGAERFTSRDPSGNVISDESSTGANDTATSTVVDYPDNAWWTLTNDPADRGDPGFGTDPASLRQQLADGDLVKVGTDTIDGQPAIHLRYPSPVLSIDGKTAYTDTSDIWVDETSYLPIREVGSNRVGVANREGSQWQSTLQWSDMPPASVDVPIPAGFTHLSGPPPNLLTTTGGRG
jgi:hypothetical protein